MEATTLTVQTAAASTAELVLRRLDDVSFRRRIYVLLAATYLLMGWLLSAGKAVQRHEQVDFVLRDAEGYYVYLPSVVIHGDLDFKKSLAVHSTMQDVNPHEFDSPSGGQRNKYPLGIALTLAPAFVFGHVAAMGLHHLSSRVIFVPNGYSLPYQLLCTAFAMAIGCWGMCMADGMIIRQFAMRGRTIGAAILVYWTGTNYTYYFFHEPLMSHMISATWVIAATSMSQRIIAASSNRVFVGWHWPALSAAASMALICRFTNASIVVPLTLIAAVCMIRAGQLTSVLKCLPIILMAAAPLALQLLVTRYSTGHMVLSGPRQAGYQDYEVFYWTDPKLVKTLISSRHGLFFWSPVLIVSVTGLIVHLLGGGWRDPWFAGVCIGGVVLWYLNSAWWCWSFATSFGLRSFVDVAVVFICGFALAFHMLSNVSKIGRTVILSFIAMSIVYSYIMMGLYIVNILPRDDYLLGPRGKPLRPELEFVN